MRSETDSEVELEFAFALADAFCAGVEGSLVKVAESEWVLLLAKGPSRSPNEWMFRAETCGLQ
jgi:hypothetical protein